MCIVIKVALDKHDRRALVAGAACKVTERTDEVSQPSGSSPLRRHVAHEVSVLLLDALGDSFLESLTAEILKIVVGKVLELQLIWRSLKAVRLRR